MEGRQPGDGLTRDERRCLAGLRTPAQVQAYLDGLDYSADELYRSPRSVIRDRKAHCADGALFGAAALRRLGHRPLILNLLPNGRDDEHLVALFRVDGLWGAVSKSNFSGLRFREPVYRTLRELAMSYFEAYYNVAREKTLRGYRAPLDLSRFDHLGWETSEEHLEHVVDQTDRCRRFELVPRGIERRLAPVDERSYQAGLMGANAAGLFQPAEASARRRS